MSQGSHGLVSVILVSYGNGISASMVVATKCLPWLTLAACQLNGKLPMPDSVSYFSRKSQES